MYNLIVLGAADSTSHVDYNSIICGDFNGGSAVFGLNGGNIGYTVSTVSVEIEGSVNAGFTVNTGSLKVSCATRSVTTQNSGNFQMWTVNNNQVQINQATDGVGVVDACSSGTACTSILTDVPNFSSALCNLPNTPGNSVGIDTRVTNDYDFNIYQTNNYGVAVVNVSADHTYYGGTVTKYIISSNATALKLIVLNIVCIQ
jgi:hypothetical protein